MTFSVRPLAAVVAAPFAQQAWDEAVAAVAPLACMWALHAAAIPAVHVAAMLAVQAPFAAVAAMPAVQAPFAAVVAAALSLSHAHAADAAISMTAERAHTIREEDTEHLQ
ncbi:MAG: hypothetical protein HY076_02535 [Candidatus Eisenbacteria bacterium]|uniref:Uncharacterized protein n=1 Tax=Eiseniibacteriota bacterium TaxID=2212470 RepID=A0A9D6L922_UNCEI|nr:hypothetical protein [Candidatus Eisenbacteria bacterium]MBI3539132.1 hypothetical protein [Candidatus Eisenbacteria bacterium]